MSGGGMRDERDQLMELMKRNHDIVVEKYEVQRQRNESLEKVAIEKEKMYNEIKIENDQLANTNYKLQRATDDLLNEKRLLENKLKNAEVNLKQCQDDLRVLRLNNEKQECQLKLTLEQLDTAKLTLEEVSIKKQQELELMNKENSSLVLKERDAK